MVKESTTPLIAEEFNLADVKTLIYYAKALVAPEPEYSENPVKWQKWNDLRIEAIEYVNNL